MTAADRARSPAEEQRADLVRALAPFAPWRWDWMRIAAKDPTRLLEDIFVRPSAPPLASWAITALLALIGWIAWRYLNSAPETHPLPESAGWFVLAPVAAFILIAFARPPLRSLLVRVYGLTAGRIGQRPSRVIRALILTIWRAP